jgi:hypothetical protein
MKNRIIVCFLLLLNVCHAIAGGPWPQPKGKLFYKLGYSMVTADQHFGMDGIILSNSELKASSIFAYAEYGITDKLTASLYLPFLSSNTYLGNTISSIGDTDFSLSYNVLSGGLFLSLGATLGLPLGKDLLDSGNAVQQTGDGEFNQLFFTDLGTGFNIGGLNFYTTARLGYNNRTSNFSDEFHAGFKIGTSFFNQRLGVSLALLSVSPLEKDASQAVQPIGLFSNRAKFFGFTPEMYYKFTDALGLVASLGGATSSSEYILARPMISFGVFGTIGGKNVSEK